MSVERKNSYIHFLEHFQSDQGETGSDFGTVQVEHLETALE